ncbi:MAG: hypothetical protein DRI46_12085 [Chloroflexi bacterium]|nr:MAG: hypothetical protein DRI46_12085 [Chloroflexota bacterium]
MSTEDEVREAFEEWVRENSIRCNPNGLFAGNTDRVPEKHREKFGDYVDLFVNSTWVGFQAGAAWGETP